MKTTLKIKLISLLSLLISLCAAFCVFVAMSSPVKSASADAAQYESKDDGFDIMGLSIKYIGASGEDGMRIGIKLSRTLYDSIWADGDARMGVLVAPVDKCPGGNLNLFNYKTAKAKRTNLISRASGYSHFQVADTYAIGIVYLDGFPEASYNRPIGVRAFIDWDNAGTSATVSHSEMVKLSMADVALAIRKDYEGSNTYGTTADQYAKLDTYLLSYNVDFYDDFYNRVGRQTVKYGSTFSVPSNPTARAGFTLNGWLPQNSASGYASSVFNMSTGDRTVKYAKAFKADYSKTGGATTFEKPVLSSWLYGANEGVEQSVSALKVKGAYLLGDSSTVANHATFMMQATFTRASGASEVGFVVTTTAAASWNGSVKNFMCVYRKTQSDFYFWGSGIWHPAGTIYAPAAGNTITMTLVHANSTYYMFINGTSMFDFKWLSETATYDGAASPRSALGTSSPFQLGIVSAGALTTFTDWRYSTDTTLINSYVKTSSGKPALSTWLYGGNPSNTVSNGTLSLKGAYLMSGASVSKGTSFAIKTVLTRSSSPELGFIVTNATDWSGNVKNMLMVYRGGSSDIYFWGPSLWLERKVSGMVAVGTSFTFTLLYKNGTYSFYVNGNRILAHGETDKPDWNSTVASNLTGATVYLGLVATNTATTYTDWCYILN